MPPSPPHRQPAPPLAVAVARVRWDRVGRVALLVALAGVLLLYVGPARSFVSTWRESHRQAAQVRVLEREHRALQAEHRTLRDPATLEQRARSLGMVRPDERSYVITGLPRR